MRDERISYELLTHAVCMNGGDMFIPYATFDQAKSIEISVDKNKEVHLKITAPDEVIINIVLTGSRQAVVTMVKSILNRP